MENWVVSETTDGVRERFGDVVEHGRRLLRLELALATDRVHRRVGALRRGLTLIALAAVLGLTALLALTGALIDLLATVWPLWLSAMAVAAAVGVLAALVGRAGTHHLKGERAWHLGITDDDKGAE